MIALLAALLFSAPACAQDMPPGCALPPAAKPEPILVYSRKPAHNTPLPWKGLVLPGASNWQRARDVGVIYGPLAEEDLILDDNGATTVIENCTGDHSRICAATEPAVSPDGRRIAYSFGTGSRLTPVDIWGGPQDVPGLFEFIIERSEIRIYDRRTGQIESVDSGPWRDWAPNWASDDLLVMASDREGKYPGLGHHATKPDGSEVWNNYYPLKGSQIWRIRTDGTGAVNLTPHEQLAGNPYAMSNGDICYSTWQAYGERAFGQSSPRNDWWVMCMDINGRGKAFADLGAHGYNGGIKTRAYTPTLRGGEGHTGLKALRPVSEIRPGTRCVTSYYRSNSGTDAGIIPCYEASDAEGARTQAEIAESVYQSTTPGSGRFLKRTIRVMTPYANDQDRDPRYEKDPPHRAAGRAGGATASLKGRWVFVHHRGECYRATPMDNYKRLGGEPWCNREIREALADRITDPFDPSQSRVLVGGLDHHRISPRVVASYQDLMGMPRPAIAPIIEPTGTTGGLVIEDLRANELYSVLSNASDEKFPGQLQNNAEPDYAQRVSRFCATYVELHDEIPTAPGFKSEGPKICADMEQDGSVMLGVKCEQPFIMTGEDKEGGEVARDRMVHSLRCGEIRACTGCHDAHSDTRMGELGNRTPLELFLGTDAGKPILQELLRYQAEGVR